MNIISKQDMIEALRDAGFRITRQRLAIVAQMAGRLDHPSVKQMYNEINTSKPEISLATVYNTLNALVDLRLLKEIEFEESDNRFDTNLTPHINLICTVCGRIDDYMVKLPVRSSKLAREKGFETSDYCLEYRGTCNSCRTK